MQYGGLSIIKNRGQKVQEVPRGKKSTEMQITNPRHGHTDIYYAGGKRKSSTAFSIFTKSAARVAFDATRGMTRDPARCTRLQMEISGTQRFKVHLDSIFNSTFSQLDCFLWNKSGLKPTKIIR